MIERQEIHCHNCNNYIQFDIDVELDGNHVLKCPKCEHEHCRVVKKGKITGDRWDQRNGFTHYVTTATITYSGGSNYSLYVSNTNAVGIGTVGTASTSYFTYDAWTVAAV